MSDEWREREELTAAACWRVADVRAWNNGPVASNAESDAWESSRAREDVTSLGWTVDSTRNLGVVGGNDCGREIQQRGPSVGDGVN